MNISSVKVLSGAAATLLAYASGVVTRSACFTIEKVAHSASVQALMLSTERAEEE